MFLILPHEEAFYGGAAAGGKSATILMAATQYVDVPGYAAIIFRRTLSDLQQSGALLDVAHKWWDGRPDVKWDGDAHMFRFKGGGTISFGYSDDKRDISRYLGTEYQFIGFDEVTTWEDESPYDALHQRLRKTIDLDVPLRIRAASNPGEVGHEWVMKLFVDPGTKPTAPCELNCGLCRFCAGIPYIPATVEDNPYLDPRYKRTLDATTDPVRKAQMRYGDWRIMPKGNVLVPEWFKLVKP